MVTEDPEGDYWSWWEVEKEKFTLTWPSKVQLEMCFPYGMAVAEKWGQSKGMRVSIVRRDDEPILTFAEWEANK
jgi:hypothetical protein